MPAIIILVLLWVLKRYLPVGEFASHSLTVGIAARDRPLVLAQCLASLQFAQRWIHRVVIVDDASRENLETACAGTLAVLPEDFRRKFHFIRRESSRGYITARNEIVRAAETEAVLILDDDAYLLPSTRLEEVLLTLAGDERVAVVALACCDAEERRLPLYLQPSRADYRCLVNSHIGYAHLLRRSAFLALSGYREIYEAYGEEKEFCLRAWDAGWRIVYCPEAFVVHTHSMVGRDHKRGPGINSRNTLYGAILNEPWPLPLLTSALHLRRLAIHQHTLRGRWGVSGVLSDVFRALPQLMRDRRPVRWRTIQEWRRRRKEVPAYPARVN